MKEFLQQFNVSGIITPEPVSAVVSGSSDCSDPINNCGGGFGCGDCDINTDGGE